MKVSFRQGLISFQHDVNGRPQFLKPSTQSGYVALNVSPTPSVVTFAHKSSDYLQVFDQTSVYSWGPLVAGNDNYLYWDIDLLNANVTTGITFLEPVYSLAEPMTKSEDQHWFDLNEKVMKVWSARNEKWVSRIRAFAGFAENGNTNQIVSFNAGTQASLDASADAGYIILDSQLRPLRTSTGEFLTSQTSVRVKTTSGTSGVLAKPLNAFVPVRVGENIPAMSVVYFSKDDEVSLASSNPANVNVKIPVGIIQQTLGVNEIGDLTQRGEITYDQWDWGNNAGVPLYFDDFGALTLIRPQGLLAYHVGVVKNKNTIIFAIDAETQPQVYQATAAAMIVNGVSPIVATRSNNQIGEVITSLSIEPASTLRAGSISPAQVGIIDSLAGRFSTVETNITNLFATKAPTQHQHMVANITDLQPILDSKMSANKNFDDRYAPINLNFDNRYATLNHTHSITDVINLQSSLDTKANRFGSMTPIANVWEGVDKSGPTDVGTGQTLTTILNGKAQAVHVHAIDDISDLRNELNNKALINHTHGISQITNLQSSLDLKVNLSGNGIFTGQMIMTVEPTINEHLATKRYVDSAVAGITGGTGGPLDLFDLTNTQDPFYGDYPSAQNTETFLAFDRSLNKWVPTAHSTKDSVYNLSELDDVKIPIPYVGMLASYEFVTPADPDDNSTGVRNVTLAPGIGETISSGFYTTTQITDNRNTLQTQSEIVVVAYYDFTDLIDGAVSISTQRSDEYTNTFDKLTFSFSVVNNNGVYSLQVIAGNDYNPTTYPIPSMVGTIKITDKTYGSELSIIYNEIETFICTIARDNNLINAVPNIWVISNFLIPDATALPNRPNNTDTPFIISHIWISAGYEDGVNVGPSTGDFLMFNETTGKWQPAAISGGDGPQYLYDLLDVIAPTYGNADDYDALIWNPYLNQWQPTSILTALLENPRGPEPIDGMAMEYVSQTGRLEWIPKHRKIINRAMSLVNEARHQITGIFANSLILLEREDGATTAFSIVRENFQVGDTMTLVSTINGLTIEGDVGVEIKPAGSLSFDGAYSQIQLTLIEIDVNGNHIWIAGGLSW